MLTDIEIADVRIDPSGLKGLFRVPVRVTHIVIFADGGGGGQMHPRNDHVAAALRQAGLATFLLDILTPPEEVDRRNLFDTDLLARRDELPESVGSAPERAARYGRNDFANALRRTGAAGRS